MLYQNQTIAGFPRAQAGEQFRRLHGQAILGRLWGKFTRRAERLLNLNEVEKSHTRANRTHIGLRHVRIDQIRGSEGRCNDFDTEFRPLRGHIKDRWIGIAMAWNEDQTLPAVELVQVDDIYYVRDGHHRISVAKVLGQLEIEAQVTVWQKSAVAAA